MTLAFLALLGAPYIYDISSLRIKQPDILSLHLLGIKHIHYGHFTEYAEH